MLKTRFAAWVLAMTAMALSAGVVSGQTASTGTGQDYPNKPIRFLTSEPGGSQDLTARLLAQGIAALVGQPVIVENRVSITAQETVIKAQPDGYTLLVTGSSFWIGPLFRKTSYDPVKSYTPISFSTNSPNVVVMNPSVAIKTVKDLIDTAKAKPGALSYASASIGSSNHLAGELFKSMAGINILHVPYKGAGPALINVMGGQVQMMFATAPSSTPHIKAGKLRALAVTSERPSALFPELPTVAATLPGYETGGASAMYAPPGTPAVIVLRLNREIVKVLNQADVKEKFLSVGTETVGSTPEQLTAKVKAEMARLGKVVKDAGLRVE